MQPSSRHLSYQCVSCNLQPRPASVQLFHNLPFSKSSLPAGLDHLLHSGRGVGGSSEDGEAAELHVACFMSLVSFLAGRLETLRVAPRRSQRLHNSAARANIQSATVTETPLTDAGLDGTGQVVQVCVAGFSTCFGLVLGLLNPPPRPIVCARGSDSVSRQSRE